MDFPKQPSREAFEVKQNYRTLGRVQNVRYLEIWLERGWRNSKLISEIHARCLKFVNTFKVVCCWNWGVTLWYKKILNLGLCCMKTAARLVLRSNISSNELQLIRMRFHKLFSFSYHEKWAESCASLCLNFDLKE